MGPAAKSEAVEAPKADGRLIRSEEKAEGRLKARVYTAYCHAAGGLLLMLPAAASFFGVQLLTYLQNLELGHWVEAIERAGADDWHACLGYVYLSLGSLAVIVLRVLLTTLCSLSASRSIHHDMLHRVMRAPLHWFETTPQVDATHT